MKTQAEIEQEISRLKKEWIRSGFTFYADRISALRWVLGQQDKEAARDAS